MNFDSRDLLEANRGLLNEAARITKPDPAVLVTVATWGKGADPQFLLALQPFRQGLGFNGSIVARVPVDFLAPWISPEAQQALTAVTPNLGVYSSVSKDWLLETWG